MATVPRRVGTALAARAAPLIRFSATPASTPASFLARHYHSYDHPPSAGPFSPADRAILSAAYVHVPEHGFSQRALTLGAKDAGFPDISVSVLHGGVFDLIRYHLIERREALADRSKALFAGGEEAKKLSLDARVERLTWERLVANQNVIHRWQEALAIMAQPSYVPTCLKELALLSDEIWFLAGDGSVDPTWYTKRGSLATIYASSELFMTNDASAGFEDTREFLGRRLSEAKEFGSVLGSVGQWVGFTATAGVNVLRSKGMRI